MFINAQKNGDADSFDYIIKNLKVKGDDTKKYSTHVMQVIGRKKLG